MSARQPGCAPVDHVLEKVANAIGRLGVEPGARTNVHGDVCTMERRLRPEGDREPVFKRGEPMQGLLFFLIRSGAAVSRSSGLLEEGFVDANAVARALLQPSNE